MNSIRDEECKIKENNGNVLTQQCSQSGGDQVKKPQVNDTETCNRVPYQHEEEEDGISNAPIEILAEFLTAVMMKDYKSALRYCNIILQYEPENTTALEFYPLIQEKLKIEEDKSEENCTTDEEDSGDLDFESGSTSGHYSSADNDAYDSSSDENPSVLKTSDKTLSVQRISIQ